MREESGCSCHRIKGFWIVPKIRDKVLNWIKPTEIAQLAIKWRSFGRELIGMRKEKWMGRKSIHLGMLFKKAFCVSPKRGRSNQAKRLLARLKFPTILLGRMLPVSGSRGKKHLLFSGEPLFPLKSKWLNPSSKSPIDLLAVSGRGREFQANRHQQQVVGCSR